jgi:hypothetical protein
MGHKSDFRIIHFQEHLGEHEGVHDEAVTELGVDPFTFKEKSSSIKSFDVGRDPREGYILIQTYDVDFSYHRILINGNDIPSNFDIVAHVEVDAHEARYWRIWYTTIPNGFLVEGENTIQIIAGDDDDFLINDVIINFREKD